ncbi:hypothetical protein F4859DRAFT_490102 [Xylaria cf. heliscus]|nr:hypothetical protein F4859DRAFT_490102 [Xylaria cf. heliscus]
MPYSSDIVADQYCKELRVWVTLHEDLVLRFWSHRTPKPVVSLPILQGSFDNQDWDVIKLKTTLKFCPAKPEFINM